MNFQSSITIILKQLLLCFIIFSSIGFHYLELHCPLLPPPTLTNHWQKLNPQFIKCLQSYVKLWVLSPQAQHPSKILILSKRTWFNFNNLCFLCPAFSNLHSWSVNSQFFHQKARKTMITRRTVTSHFQD